MTVKEFCLVPRVACERSNISHQPPSTATSSTRKEGESYITRIAPQLESDSDPSPIPTLPLPTPTSFSTCSGGGCKVDGANTSNARVRVAAQRVVKKKTAVKKHVGDLPRGVPNRGAPRSRAVPTAAKPRYRLREPTTSLRRRRTPNPSLSHMISGAYTTHDNRSMAEGIIEWLERERPEVRWSSDGVFYAPVPGLSVLTLLRHLMRVSDKKDPSTKKEKKLLKDFISVVSIPHYVIPTSLRSERSAKSRTKDEEMLAPLLNNLGWVPY